MWSAAFSFAKKAEESMITQVEKSMKVKLPDEYKEFLLSVANGATLYYDEKYGQWGYKLYGTNELANEYANWRFIFFGNLGEKFIIIGQLMDELHPIIMRENDDQIFTLLEGNPLEPYDEWLKIADSLEEWFERLITSQGAKYWDWCN